VKIIILNTQAVFVSGGAEYLAVSLKTKLVERGHEVEIVRIPFNWSPPERILDSIMMCRLLKINPIEPDLVIALKFPVYFVPFENKKLWLLHQFRQVYELWGTQYQDLPNTPEGEAIRAAIIQADNRYLPEARAIYTNSKIVAGRLKTFNHIQATDVLYPPLLQPEIYRRETFGDYFFYPSRLVSSKRQNVAIEAMRYTRSNFKLVLAGSPDIAGYDDELKQLIHQYHLENRVTMLGYISEAEKAHLMANAFSVLYLPYDEDSYGYVTLEAFHSSKPVITFTDSGGTDEVIEHEINGLMLAPTPQALAEGMESLWARRQRTMEMGEAAHQTISKHNINWDHIISKLLA
jgi:glycosyltransferase involved in cell wall biosynthesis